VEEDVSKVLWIGDAGCHTGFARVTHAIGERLVSDYGHDVHVLATNYDGGDPWDTNLKLHVPTTKDRNDIFGQSRFLELLAKIEPDVVVILNDPNIILDLLGRNKHDPQMVLIRYRPLLTYIPIDGTNHPPEWAPALHKFTKVVAMSAHGQRELGEGTELVYHGVDTDRFYPVSKDRPLTLSNGKVIASKTDAKRAFGFDPQDFLVLRVDKNSGRKDYPASWKALVPFMHRNSNVKVHFHCEDRKPGNGIDMQALFSRDPETHSRFHMPNPQSFDSFRGWSEEDLVALYNAADVFVSTSRGEGFGLTIGEAMACGVPVVAQNVSAIPEVVGDGGILIDPVGEITTPSGKDNWLADVPAFTAALQRLYQSRGLRRDLGQKAREHVVKSFSWDVAAQQFHGHIGDVIAAGEKAAKQISEGEPDAKP
jgi:glycosyltransferase involved in cell wall biosynthesis